MQHCQSVSKRAFHIHTPPQDRSSSTACRRRSRSSCASCTCAPCSAPQSAPAACAFRRCCGVPSASTRYSSSASADERAPPLARERWGDAAPGARTAPAAPICAGLAGIRPEYVATALRGLSLHTPRAATAPRPPPGFGVPGCGDGARRAALASPVPTAASCPFPLASEETSPPPGRCESFDAAPVAPHGLFQHRVTGAPAAAAARTLAWLQPCAEAAARGALIVPGTSLNSSASDISPPSPPSASSCARLGCSACTRCSMLSMACMYCSHGTGVAVEGAPCVACPAAADAAGVP